MKQAFLALFIALLTTPAFAQNTVILTWRTAVENDGTVLKNFAEVTLEKDRWIPLDIVAIGKPDGRTSEVAIGGGRKIVALERLTWTSELLLVKDLGEKTSKGFYLQPFNSFSGALGAGFRYQAVVIPYIPIGGRSRVQFVLERLRLVKDIKIGTLGVGIGGAKSGSNDFQARPLISFQPKGWPVDFWYQTYLPTRQSPHTRHTFQARFFLKRKI